MEHQNERTEWLLGRAGLARLAAARVAVFGVGGVGSFAAEALARAGVGALDLIDNDVVTQSNLNRQLVALHSTLWQNKAQAMRRRCLDIQPHMQVCAVPMYFDAATAGQFDFASYDYVVDAIDSVTSKLLLVQLCQAADTTIISCMGAGNKLDPTRLEVADIYETSVCPLAKVMRRELRRRGVARLQVVYSKEPPVALRRPPGSVSFVPSVAGLILAGEVVKALAAGNGQNQT
jgi:tRNA A37 threonylcarbamoyladenosine dehydratase